MTASMNYYPHLLEYGNCHVVSETPTDVSTSIAVLLIALAASEVVILGLCKAMSWYADLIFYSQDWGAEEANAKQQQRSPKTIAQSLHTFMYERRLGVSAEESICPICLVEFGEWWRWLFVL